MRLVLFSTAFLLFISSITARRPDILLPQAEKNEVSIKSVDELLALSQKNNASDAAASLHYARTALGFSVELHYEEGKCQAYNKIGSAFLHLSEYDSAAYYFQLAMSGSRTSGFHRVLAQAELNMGHLFTTQGVYDSAFHHFHQSLEWAEKNKDEAFRVKGMISIAEMWRRQGDLQKAKSWLLESRRMATSGNYDDELSLTNQNLGIVYDQLDIPDSSIYFTKLAYEYFEKTGNTKGMADCCVNLGIVLEWTEEYDEAKLHYEKAILLFQQLGDSLGSASAALNRAALHYDLGKQDEAKQEGMRLVDIAKKLDALPLELLIHETMSDWYQREGNYEKAYEEVLLSNTLRNTIMDREKMKTIEGLQAKYETVKKENQIAQQEQTILEKEARNKSLLIFFILLAAAAILVFIFLRHRMQIAKKDAVLKTKQVEELISSQEIKTYNALIDGQESERKRIAMELHDRLGNLLITAQLHAGKKDDGGSTEQNVILDEALQEVRRISRNLSSGTIHSFGLVSALKELCFNIESSGHFLCSFMTNCAEERFDSGIEINLYRIVQETLTNAVKYSRAKKVSVQLHNDETTLTLTIEDDGVGFDTTHSSTQKGMGMQNIRSRADKISASVSIESSQGEGALTMVVVPLTKGK